MKTQKELIQKTFSKVFTREIITTQEDNLGGIAEKTEIVGIIETEDSEYEVVIARFAKYMPKMDGRGNLVIGGFKRIELNEFQLQTLEI